MSRREIRDTIRPLLFLGAGASVPFGIPAMGKFLEDTWRELETDNVPAAIAIRRSLELLDGVDLEEVMFLLDRIADMSRESAEASVFLTRVQGKFGNLKQIGSFDEAVAAATEAREQIRRQIYETCVAYDADRVTAFYSALFRSLALFSDSARLYVVTTNYDRIVESLWESESEGLHVGAPPLELQTGFFSRPYGNPMLDTKRGYPEKSEEADAVIHLVKLHGSLGWREYEQGRVEDTAAREYPADYAVLAYPIRSDKSTAPPFDELFRAFDDALAKSNFLVLVGTSLRDVAVAARIADALRAGGKVAVIIDPDPELVRNRLPQDVRSHVTPLDERWVDDVAPASEDDWHSLLDRTLEALPASDESGSSP